MNNNEKNVNNSNTNGSKEKEKYNDKKYVTHSDRHVDNFDACMIGKSIKLNLINNTTIQGQLKFFGQYDIVITTQSQFRTMQTTKDIIVMKSAIITIEVV